MTQAAVSYQVKLLEERLGAALFVRERGRARLTGLGQRLLPQLTQAFDTIEAAFASQREEDEALLTVATTFTFANTWLAWRLGSFQVDEDDTDESLSKGEIEAIGDRKAIAVTGGEGKDRVTAWVAIDAPHLVLKMAPVRQGAFEEALFFEEFGGEVDAETPKKADIVSLPKG